MDSSSAGSLDWKLAEGRTYLLFKFVSLPSAWHFEEAQQTFVEYLEGGYMSQGSLRCKCHTQLESPKGVLQAWLDLGFR